MIKTITKKKKCKKAKWLSKEALQIVEKRREAKDKGEKERYTHLNAEFQRTARRDKKYFLDDQCKDIEKNTQIFLTQESNQGLLHCWWILGQLSYQGSPRGKQQNGKNQRSLQEVIVTKGIFHAKVGTIKDRNSMDLTETEDIKKRLQEYTELYRKDLMTQINMRL